MILSENPKSEMDRIYNKYVNHSDYTKERREDVLARELKRSIDRIDGLKIRLRMNLLKVRMLSSPCLWLPKRQ